MAPTQQRVRGAFSLSRPSPPPAPSLLSPPAFPPERGRTPNRPRGAFSLPVVQPSSRNPLSLSLSLALSTPPSATAASRPTHIIHLAAILSAAGEADPARALAVNCDGAAAVLAAAAAHGCAVFSPSTIAVYGSCAHPPSHTPDTAPQRPSTMYGVTKVFQECLGEYYAARWGVDYRSLRLPGVVSADAPPGGGTTDWACAIYEAALDGVPFTCALAPDTALPYAFMPDVLAGIQALMAAPASALTRRTYSVSSFSTTPAEVAASIQKILPAFKIAYAPDFRDGIARQWPASLDDAPARSDWGWAPAVAPDVAAMSAAMLERVAARRVREAQAAVVATAAEVKAAAKSAGAGGNGSGRGGGTPRLAVAAAAAPAGHVM